MVIRVTSLIFDHDDTDVKSLVSHKEDALNAKFKELEDQGFEIFQITETSISTSYSSYDDVREYHYSDKGTVVMIYYRWKKRQSNANK